jgi:IstB-like ATP binding protein
VTGVSDTAALAAIGAAARELKLPTVRADAARLAEIAVRERQTHLGYLAELLSAEIDDRTGRRRARRIGEARFPRIRRLADFDPDAIPGIAATLATLAAGAWIDAGQPLVLLGDSGTGKSHLLIGLGLAACEQGRGPLRHHPPSSSTSSPKPPTPASYPASSAATELLPRCQASAEPPNKPRSDAVRRTCAESDGNCSVAREMDDRQ